MGWAVVGQIVTGWFVIDLITGVYHFVIDHRKPSDPVIGGQVADFQEHHENPRSMEKCGLLARVWLPTVMALPALAFARYGLPWFWWTVFAGALVSQQAHYWAHRGPLAPWYARALQQLGVLISPDAHGRHHGDFERSYGVLNGWSHGALDLLLGRRTT
jgi:hypothetical protein